MKPFDFCPACSARLGKGDDEGSKCPSCGRSWYRNSAPTAGCAIVVDGRALITQRAREPEKGRFDVPGGFLGPGEQVLDGLRREVQEELGVEIDVTIDDCVSMVAHTYGDEGDYVLALGFLARLRSGEPTAADDVAALAWISLDDIDDVDFAWEHDRELVRKALTAVERKGS
ncbi:MAG TPA: NUDIX domain-containing protein [Actinomycetota bacterium]|nr:NUDIX domain-containing protein [Actinomycetota bacterium]